MAPSPLLRRFDEEWKYLATAASTRAALARWAEVEPQLAGFADLHQLRAAVHQETDPERSDTLLACLVRLAAAEGGDDQLASRTMLQLLLPGMVAITRRLSGGGKRADLDVTFALVVAEVAIGVRSYPLHRRPRRIAANILLDAKQRIIRRAAGGGREVAAGLDPYQDLPHQPRWDDTHPEVELWDMLSWAIRHGVITRWEAELIVESRVAERSPTQLTERFGYGRSRLFALRRQAESRLRIALEDAGWTR